MLGRGLSIATPTLPLALAMSSTVIPVGLGTELGRTELGTTGETGVSLPSDLGRGGPGGEEDDMGTGLDPVPC